MKELMETFALRHSCRMYTGEQISEEELKGLLQAANAAPVGMNKVESIKLIVVQNRELIQKADQNTLDFYKRDNMKYGALFGAPTLIIVAVKKMEGIYRNMQFCTAACIVENMCLAATGLRLGNVFLTGVTSALNTNAMLSREIGIPDDYEAAAAMIVGKADCEWRKRDLEKNKFETVILH